MRALCALVLAVLGLVAAARAQLLGGPAALCGDRVCSTGETCFESRCVLSSALTCPKLEAGAVGICVELCSNASPCPAGTMCCSNGCGHACTKPVLKEERSTTAAPPTTTAVKRCAEDKECGDGHFCSQCRMDDSSSSGPRGMCMPLGQHGEGCDGFLMCPTRCAPGLMCAADPSLSPYISDAGGLCCPTRAECPVQAHECPSGKLDKKLDEHGCLVDCKCAAENKCETDADCDDMRGCFKGECRDCMPFRICTNTELTCGSKAQRDAAEMMKCPTSSTPAVAPEGMVCPKFVPPFVMCAWEKARMTTAAPVTTTPEPIKTCDDKPCEDDEACVDIKCFAPPCDPAYECVKKTTPEPIKTCDDKPCEDDEECVTINCLVAPCDPAYECVKKTTVAPTTGTPELRPCGGKHPLTNADGKIVTCGRGSGPCPDRSYCDVHPTDMWAVCCPVDPKPECPVVDCLVACDVYLTDDKGCQTCECDSDVGEAPEDTTIATTEAVSTTNKPPMPGGFTPLTAEELASPEVLGVAKCGLRALPVGVKTVLTASVDSAAAPAAGVEVLKGARQVVAGLVYKLVVAAYGSRIAITVYVPPSDDLSCELKDYVLLGKDDTTAAATPGTDATTATTKPSCPEVMCEMFCEAGFKTDETTGCPKCECNDIADSTMPSTTEPECPEMLCAIECSKGLKEDEDGCPICECVEVEEPTKPTTEEPKCPEMLCDVFCEGGFKTDEASGCPICECEETEATSSTAAAPATTSTTTTRPVPTTAAPTVVVSKHVHKKLVIEGLTVETFVPADFLAALRTYLAGLRFGEVVIDSVRPAGGASRRAVGVEVEFHVETSDEGVDEVVSAVDHPDLVTTVASTFGGANVTSAQSAQVTAAPSAGSSSSSSNSNSTAMYAAIGAAVGVVALAVVVALVVRKNRTRRTAKLAPTSVSTFAGYASNPTYGVVSSGPIENVYSFANDDDDNSFGTLA